MEVFEATYVDVVRFAARRIDPGRAEDIAAEAFAVAWRRLDALPLELGQARAWLAEGEPLLGSRQGAQGRRTTGEASCSVLGSGQIRLSLMRRNCSLAEAREVLAEAGL